MVVSPHNIEEGTPFRQGIPSCEIYYGPVRVARLEYARANGYVRRIQRRRAHIHLREAHPFMRLQQHSLVNSHALLSCIKKSSSFKEMLEHLVYSGFDVRTLCIYRMF